MSEEQKLAIAGVFEMHKRWVDEGMEQAKEYARERSFSGMLQNFYKATLALKGLEAVFRVDVPEARAYTKQKKAEIVKKDIPELVNILRQKCKIHP